MKVASTVTAISGVAVLSACSAQSPEAERYIVAVAQINTADGTMVGEAELTKAGDILTLGLSLSGLPEGPRAFHLHETAACDAPSFIGAGGHLNPLAKAHGKLSEDGPHLGDLPNIDIAADGTFKGDFHLDGSASDLLANLFDEDGTAVMLHAGADDYRTDPSGAAGPRLACGVLKQA